MTQKTCTKCGETKAVSEFGRHKGKRDGLESNCKQCKVAYRKANDEHIREYRSRNAERTRQYFRERYENTYGKGSNYHKDYYQRNKETAAAYNLRYQREHKEKLREQRRKNPEMARTYNNARRARLLNAEGTHTAVEWLGVVWKQRFACAHCGGIKPLTRDHIIPLSRGGSNYISNIQGLCLPCNSSKGAKMPDELKRSG